MLTKSKIESVLAMILEKGGDFGELFIEDTTSTEMTMTNGKLEKVNSGRMQGIGIRAFLDTNSVYAYTNDFSLPNLMKVAIRVAAALFSHKAEGITVSKRNILLEKHRYPSKVPILVPFEEVEKLRKKEVMRIAHQGAKEYSPLITQVEVRYRDVDQKVCIANTDDVYTSDQRRRTRIMVNAIATKGAERETGTCSPGISEGFEFYDRQNLFAVGQEAARVATRMVQADFAPAGTMPVVLSNGFGGVIFHEACGHALEATAVAKGASVFCGKLGQLVANECVSAVDDGTIQNAWGTSTVDDEGTPTRRNVLIENGILKSYLIDKLNARRMKMEATGSSRRQDYTFDPTSRMTNTFLLPGKSIPEEIIASVEYGLFAKRMGGGSVLPTTGDFNFAVLEGYLIEHGRITKPVRGATLIGKGYEVLKKIDLVANDLERAQGMCGSASGSIPTDVGQPTIRVSEMIVGGRNQ